MPSPEEIAALMQRVPRQKAAEMVERAAQDAFKLGSESGSHKRALEFIAAMGQGHYSRTDAKWHVTKFQRRILREERLRIIQLLREVKVGNVVLERQIYPP